MDKEYKPFNRCGLLQFLGFSLAGSSLSPMVFSEEMAIPDKRPSPPGMDPLPDQMLRHLKQANKTARAAMEEVQ